MADNDALYNAVLNLVTNAFDAVESKGGGNVRVALRQDPISPSQLMLSVADNGPGIPLEIQQKIFQLFFSTKGRNGTGIGLAATKKIVEEIGGSIALDSQPGEGATFTLYLPVAKQGAEV
ncbi:MAG: ATP-binding protein [Candidatus Sumerlaeota bacterium]|nr:ATP-binding protein [Candidatus Sumerlaeota bacterium]